MTPINSPKKLICSATYRTCIKYYSFLINQINFNLINISDIFMTVLPYVPTYLCYFIWLHFRAIQTSFTMFLAKRKINWVALERLIEKLFLPCVAFNLFLIFLKIQNARLASSRSNIGFNNKTCQGLRN